MTKAIASLRIGAATILPHPSMVLRRAPQQLFPLLSQAIESQQCSCFAKIDFTPEQVQLLGAVLAKDKTALGAQERQVCNLAKCAVKAVQKSHGGILSSHLAGVGLSTGIMAAISISSGIAAYGGFALGGVHLVEGIAYAIASISSAYLLKVFGRQPLLELREGAAYLFEKAVHKSLSLLKSALEKMGSAATAVQTSN